MGSEVESGRRVKQEHESPNKSLRLSLPIEDTLISLHIGVESSTF
jgi:hypothetical protein